MKYNILAIGSEVGTGFAYKIDKRARSHDFERVGLNKGTVSESDGIMSMIGLGIGQPLPERNLTALRGPH
jgi:hypothetical protein